MDLREAEAGAKDLQNTLATVLGVVGVVAGALGLAAVIYEAFKPATVAAAKPGCNTCGPKNYLP